MASDYSDLEPSVAGFVDEAEDIGKLCHTYLGHHGNDDPQRRCLGTRTKAPPEDPYAGRPGSRIEYGNLDKPFQEFGEFDLDSKDYETREKLTDLDNPFLDVAIRDCRSKRYDTRDAHFDLDKQYPESFDRESKDSDTLYKLTDLDKQYSEYVDHKSHDYDTRYKTRDKPFTELETPKREKGCWNYEDARGHPNPYHHATEVINKDFGREDKYFHPGHLSGSDIGGNTACPTGAALSPYKAEYYHSPQDQRPTSHPDHSQSGWLAYKHPNISATPSRSRASWAFETLQDPLGRQSSSDSWNPYSLQSSLSPESKSIPERYAGQSSVPDKMDQSSRYPGAYDGRPFPDAGNYTAGSGYSQGKWEAESGSNCNWNPEYTNYPIRNYDSGNTMGRSQCDISGCPSSRGTLNYQQHQGENRHSLLVTNQDHARFLLRCSLPNDERGLGLSSSLRRRTRQEARIGLDQHTPRMTRRLKLVESSASLAGELSDLDLYGEGKSSPEETDRETAGYSIGGEGGRGGGGEGEESDGGYGDGDCGGGEGIDTISPDINLQGTDILKKIPSKNRRRVRGPKSWEFLMRLLTDPRSNPGLVKWEDESDGTFRLVQPDLVAQLWSSRSGLATPMSYNNFARGLRYHYSTGALEPVSERQLVYRCGHPATQYLQELKDKKTP